MMKILKRRAIHNGFHIHCRNNLPASLLWPQYHHRQSDNGRPRTFSSVGTAKDEEEAAKQLAAVKQAIARQQLPARPIFPWRHEHFKNRIPRLVSGTRESLNDFHPHPRYEMAVAHFFLKVPLWQILLTSQWRDNLADASSWAFAQGVAGIVSNVYRVPFRQVSLTSEANKPGVKFDFLMPDVVKGPSPPTDEEGNPGRKKEGVELDEDYCPEVENMLGRSLRNLFTSAHQSGRDQLRIQLETQPVLAALFHVFALPFVSRSAVERDPAFRQLVRDLYYGRSPLNFMDTFNRVYKLMEYQMDRDGKMSTTVDIQVVVSCDELFRVLDAETGAVLQGSPNGTRQKVLHLVRLETTVETTFSDSIFSLTDTRPGNWQITDIDDLVSSKTWYQNI